VPSQLTSSPFAITGCALTPLSARLRASLIDLALLIFLLVFLLVGLHLIVPILNESDSGTGWSPLLSLMERRWTQILLVLGVSWLYFTGLESSPIQATVGKLFVDCRVSTVQLGRVSVARATVRFVVKALSVVVLPVLLISALIAYRFERAQALHDLFARTLVIPRGK